MFDTYPGCKVMSMQDATGLVVDDIFKTPH